MAGCLIFHHWILLRCLTDYVAMLSGSRRECAEKIATLWLRTSAWNCWVARFAFCQYGQTWRSENWKRKWRWDSGRLKRKHRLKDISPFGQNTPVFCWVQTFKYQEDVHEIHVTSLYPSLPCRFSIRGWTHPETQHRGAKVQAPGKI